MRYITTVPRFFVDTKKENTKRLKRRPSVVKIPSLRPVAYVKERTFAVVLDGYAKNRKVKAVSGDYFK